MFKTTGKTIFGNSMVILAVRKEKSLQSVTNYLIVSLASADLLVALCVMFFAVYYEWNSFVWDLGPSLCNLYIGADVACSTASILNLLAISIDRYIAISHPLAYCQIGANSSRACLSIALVWAVSIAVAVPVAFGANHIEQEHDCLFTNPDFMIGSSIFSLFVQCLAMIALYPVIFRSLREREKARDLWREEQTTGTEASLVLNALMGGARMARQIAKSLLKDQLLLELSVQTSLFPSPSEEDEEVTEKEVLQIDTLALPQSNVLPRIRNGNIGENIKNFQNQILFNKAMSTTNNNNVNRRRSGGPVDGPPAARPRIDPTLQNNNNNNIQTNNNNNNILNNTNTSNNNNNNSQLDIAAIIAAERQRAAAAAATPQAAKLIQNLDLTTSLTSSNYIFCGWRNNHLFDNLTGRVSFVHRGPTARRSFDRADVLVDVGSSNDLQVIGVYGYNQNAAKLQSLHINDVVKFTMLSVVEQNQERALWTGSVPYVLRFSKGSTLQIISQQQQTNNGNGVLPANNNLLNIANNNNNTHNQLINGGNVEPAHGPPQDNLQLNNNNGNQAGNGLARGSRANGNAAGSGLHLVDLF